MNKKCLVLLNILTWIIVVRCQECQRYEFRPQSNQLSCTTSQECQNKCTTVNKEICTVITTYSCTTYKRRNCVSTPQTICKDDDRHRVKRSSRRKRSLRKFIEKKKRFFNKLFGVFETKRPDEPTTEYQFNPENDEIRTHLNVQLTLNPSSTKPTWTSNTPQRPPQPKPWNQDRQPWIPLNTPQNDPWTAVNPPNQPVPPPSPPPQPWKSQQKPSYYYLKPDFYQQSPPSSSNCYRVSKKKCEYVPYRKECRNTPSNKCQIRPQTECKKTCKRIYTCCVTAPTTTTTTTITTTTPPPIVIGPPAPPTVIGPPSPPTDIDTIVGPPSPDLPFDDDDNDDDDDFIIIEARKLQK